MTINDDFERERSGASGMARNAASFLPFAIGVGVGVSRIRSNEPVSLLGPGKSFGQSVGIEAGRKLKGTLASEADRRAKLSQQLAENILKSNEFEELWKNKEGQQVVLQSLKSTLDDPASGLDPAVVAKLRSQVEGLITGGSDRGSAQEGIRKAIETVLEGGSSNAAQKFTGYWKGLGKLKGLLREPVGVAKSGLAINPMSERSLSAEGVGRLDRLRGIVGKSNIELVEMKEADGIVGHYAKVFSQFGEKPQWITNIALDLKGSTRGGIPIVRMGKHGSAAYRADQDYVWAQRLLDMNGRGEDLSHSNLKAKGVLRSFGDVQLDLLEKEVTSSGSVSFVNPRNFNAHARSYLTGEDRAAGVLANQPINTIAGMFGSHLKARSKMAGSTMKILGIEGLSKRDQDVWPQMMISKVVNGRYVDNGFDLGVGAESMYMRDTMGHVTSSVGIAATSPIASMKMSSIPSNQPLRHSSPITARERQIAGRDTMFLERKREGLRGRLGQSFRTGRGASNIEWNADLTGGMNRAVLMDVLDKTNQGEAFSMRGGTVLSTITKPILDPKEHKNFGSALLEHILDPKNQVNKMVTLTPAQLKKHGHFLGWGPNGEQFLRADPFAHSVTVRVVETIDDDGKKMVHVSGFQTKRINKALKWFSTLFKGNQQKISGSQMHKLLKKMGTSEKELAAQGIRMTDLLATSGDMLKKSPDALASQMISGLGLMTELEADPYEYIAKQVNKDAVGKLNAPHKLGHVTEAVIDELAKRGVDAKHAGMVLAGVYNLGEDDSMAGFKINRESIEKHVAARFGQNAGDVITSMKKGVAIGATTLVSGPTPGEWGASMGSMEQRVVRMMQQRLRQMGMNEGQVSDFVMNLVSRRQGIEHIMSSVDELTKLQSSVLGQRTPLDEIGKNVRRLSITDLEKIVREDTLEALLKSEDGVLVDLASSNTAAGQAIKASAAKVFGGQSEVYLPGKRALEAMRSAGIKTSEGLEVIAPRYLSAVKEFSQNIVGLHNNAGAARTSSGDLFRSFRGEVADMWTGALGSVVSGKIRGSQFMLGLSYDMAGSANLSGQQTAFIGKVFKKTRGTAVWADSHAFLGAMSSFMGTTQDTSDVSDRMRQFFLSSEGGAGTAKGAAGFMTRHPVMSMGHVAPVQYFRSVDELRRFGSKGDATLGAFARTKAGRGALNELSEKLETKVRSFSDIAANQGKNSGAVDTFFHRMTQELPNFHSTEGGGTLYFPQMTAKLDVKGRGSLLVQMSTSVAQFGDFDGDYYQMMMMDKKLSGQLMDTIVDPAKSGEWVGRETRYRAMGGVMMDELKQAMSGGGELAGDKILQDIMKEKTLKGIGPLDVKLNMLRGAVVNYGGSGAGVDDALAMIKTLEEGIGTKAKKMETYQGFEKSVAASVGHMFEYDDDSIFRSIMKNSIFKGGNLFSNEGTTINSAQVAGSGSFMTEHLNGVNAKGDDIVDLIFRSARAAKEAGGVQSLESQPRQVSALNNDRTGSSTFNDLAVAGRTEAGAIYRGYSDDLMKAGSEAISDGLDTLKNAVGKMDRNLMAPVVAGTMGTLALGAMLGANEYSAEPMVMPGEYVSPSVSNEIAQGSLFNGKQVGPTPDMIGGGSAPAMLDRVINPSQMYAERPNAYQIRGEVGNSYGFGQASSLLRQALGARGSGQITVNDRRRPITSSYIDRMTGE